MDTTPLNARFYTGTDASAYDIELFLTETHLTIASDPPQEWALAETTARAMDATPLVLEHQNGTGIVMISDARTAQTVRAALTPFWRTPRRKKRTCWLAATAAAWLLVFAANVFGPDIVTGTTRAFPASWEKSIGKTSRSIAVAIVTETLFDAAPLVENTPETAILDRLIQRIAQTTPGGHSFSTALVHSNIVNAFALPGEYVVVTTGLIRRCLTPEELAGVLAHEITHAAERHSIRTLMRSELIGFPGKIFLGGNKAFTALGLLANSVAEARNSRDDENEADILGARRLKAVGISPMELAQFFTRMHTEDLSAFDRIFTEHPDMASRIAHLQNEAATGPKRQKPAMRKQEWRQLKKFAAKD